jgi:hypothetical protein
MKATQLMKEDDLLHGAISALMEKLGPVETSRFLAMDRPRRTESIKRHRKWQKSLDREAFLTEVFGN